MRLPPAYGTTAEYARIPCGGAGDPDSCPVRSRMASPDLLSDAQSVLFSRAPDSAPVADQRNVFPFEPERATLGGRCDDA
jgi:hypothetical protein